MKDKIIEILKNNTVIRGDVGLPVITINYEKVTTELKQLLTPSDYISEDEIDAVCGEIAGVSQFSSDHKYDELSVLHGAKQGVYWGLGKKTNTTLSDYRRVKASERLPDRLLSDKNKYSRVSEHLHLITESNLKCTGHYDFIDKKWHIDTYEAIESPKYWIEPITTKTEENDIEQIKLIWQKHNRDNGLSWNEVGDLCNEISEYVQRHQFASQTKTK